MKLKLKTNQPEGVMRLSDTPEGCLCIVVEVDNEHHTKTGDIIVRGQQAASDFAWHIAINAKWQKPFNPAADNPLVRILKEGELLEVSE